MKRLAGILLLFILLLGLYQVVGAAQIDNHCPPGQSPGFILGFAFLKSQLGDLMGEPVECEYYDEAGNAYQQTTTGQAFYERQTNTPIFSSSGRRWAWTSQGLEQWTGQPGLPAVEVRAAAPATTPQSIRVMSYNVLYGAGATPYWEEIAATQPGFKYPGNRLPAVLEVIKGAEPDIVGIQEAAGWNSGSPLIIEQVAAELGMNQFLALSPSGLNLALLTKFEIVETENLSYDVGNIGVLRATLAIDSSGQQVHVFVVHLDPFSAVTRAEQIGRLTQAMEPYRQAPTILMGDTNIECVDRPEQCQEYQVLSQAGWQLVVKERYLINQIWSSPLLAGSAGQINFPGVDFSMSDHLPVGAVFEISRASP